jgi:hypothetical protein
VSCLCVLFCLCLVSVFCLFSQLTVLVTTLCMCGRYLSHMYCESRYVQYVHIAQNNMDLF